MADATDFIIMYFDIIHPSRWVKSWEGPFLATEGLTTSAQVVETKVANESTPWDVSPPPPLGALVPSSYTTPGFKPFSTELI